jgi:hypothetical protein
MPQTMIGGVSSMVAARMTSLPKFGERFRSSMVKTYVMPALYAEKPSNLGESDSIFGQYRIRATGLLARFLGK